MPEHHYIPLMTVMSLPHILWLRRVTCLSHPDGIPVIEDSVGYLRRAKREGLIGQVDFFFHDSLHTLEHLSSELYEISSIMSNSGLIVADNMEMESGRALEDFGRRTHRKVHRFGNLGFLA